MNKFADHNRGLGTTLASMSLLVLGGVFALMISLSNLKSAIRQKSSIWKAGTGFYSSEYGAAANFAVNNNSGCGVTTLSQYSSSGIPAKTASHVCLQRSVGSGYYTMASQSSALCLEAQNSSTKSGTAIVGNICASNQDDEIWEFVKTDSGFQILAHHGGLCLTGISAGSKNVGAVQLFPCDTNNSSQAFHFVPVGEGSYQIEAQRGLCLTLLAGIAEIQNCFPPSAPSQHWFLNVVALSPVVLDGSFEVPKIARGTSLSITSVSLPGGAPPESPWVYIGTSQGVAGDGSPIVSKTGNAPDGNQVLYLGQQGAVSQFISFPTLGVFAVTLDTAQSAGSGGYPFDVLIDGTTVGTYTPLSAAYSIYTTNAFAVGAGKHFLTLRASNPLGVSTFVDSVSIQLADKQITALAGGEKFSESIVFPTQGSFVVSIKARNRTTDLLNQTVSVLVNEKVVGTFAPSSTSASSFITNAFTVLPGAYTVVLRGNGQGAATTLIDSIAIQPAEDGIETPPGYPMVWAHSTDTLIDPMIGWPASNAVDGNPASLFSTGAFTSSNNDRDSYLEAWTSETKSVSHVQFNSRLPNNQGFPLAYNIYLADPRGSGWNFIGNYTNQPNSHGVAVVSLGTVYQTKGVAVVPTVLGKDGYGDYIFQLAEIRLAP